MQPRERPSMPTRPLGSPGRTVAVVLIVAAIAGGALARASAIGGDTHVSADERGYVANANRMLGGERYATFKWPPGTSIAFAVATRAGGSHLLRASTRSHSPAQYMQLALGVLALATAAALAWLLAGPWAAVVATALLAAYEPLIDATRTFLSEPAGAFVLAAAVLAAAYARTRFGTRRELAWIALAGAIGGVACLTRGDLAPGMAVLALALAFAGHSATPQLREPADAGGGETSRRARFRIRRPAQPRLRFRPATPHLRAGLARGGVYVAALLLTLSPWLAYASATEGRFVPITTSGPDALFVGTYLPGKGLLVPTEERLAPEVCRRFPQDCGRYWQHSAAPLFALIQARHPGSSENAAVQAEDLHNLRVYALGRPAAFASMLWSKFWKMWTNVWSGGNGTYRPDTSQTQHLLYLWLAWLGLLAGAALTRRFALLASAAVLLSISLAATPFNDQPRYNVSLMALLVSAGVAGWWLAGRRLVEMYRRNASVEHAEPEPARFSASS